MNCVEFSEIVHDVLRPEQPASDAVRCGLEHALLCDDCAALLAEERNLSDQLDDLADADRGLESPSRVEHILLAAFRELHPAPRAAMPVWRWVGALGLATAAVLIGAILLIHRPIDGPAGPSAQPTTPRTESPALPLEASRLNATAPNADAQSTDQANLETASVQGQSSEQFYAMPAAFSGESSDGDSVLRVELPASALPSLGLESSPDAQADAASDDGSQMVTADVVVAEDGTLEAIRLAPDQAQDSGTTKF